MVRESECMICFVTNSNEQHPFVIEAALVNLFVLGVMVGSSKGSSEMGSRAGRVLCRKHSLRVVQSMAHTVFELAQVTQATETPIQKLRCKCEVIRDAHGLLHIEKADPTCVEHRT